MRPAHVTAAKSLKNVVLAMGYMTKHGSKSNKLVKHLLIYSFSKFITMLNCLHLSAIISQIFICKLFKRLINCSTTE